MIVDDVLDTKNPIDRHRPDSIKTPLILHLSANSPHHIEAVKLAASRIDGTKDIAVLDQPVSYSIGLIKSPRHPWVVPYAPNCTTANMAAIVHLLI